MLPFVTKICQQSEEKLYAFVSVSGRGSELEIKLQNIPCLVTRALTETKFGLV